MVTKYKDAILWTPLDNQKVQCNLCNHRCTIAPGKLGLCAVRQNIQGKLVSLNYNALCATNVDPIEKKPLFHYQPGSRSFSIAAVGCSFQCNFCQNWQISQMPRQQNQPWGQSADPQAIVNAAIRHRCRNIAYTYTEPTVFMEFCTDCGRLARKQGLGNVFVSNGYMTIEAIDLAAEFLDAINVDLKAFTDDFYKTHCKASLQPVLDTLSHIAKNTDIWLEVTTLIIPGLNDSDVELAQLAQFIADQLGPHIPWHISRFHPQYKTTDIAPTAADTLTRAHDIGQKAGLHYIYVGNLPHCGCESTRCHNCNHLLIERTGYHIGQFNLINSACPNCNTPLAGKDLQPI